jgi:hypothetical protein
VSGRTLAMFGSTADFSDCRRYRYALWRTWDPLEPGVLFVGLNPSTADEQVNDPTIRRCMGFARRWGYGGLVMCNLYALRSTDPARLFEVEDAVGPENDDWLADQAEQAPLVVAAWGSTPGPVPDRAARVLELLGEAHCLGLTTGGAPRHPLRMPTDLQAVPYRPEAADGR